MATSRRVGNYATSANAVIRNSDAIFDAAMTGKPDFTKISKEAIKGRSLERRAVTKAEAEVASAGLEAFTDVNLTRMREDTKKEIADIKRPAKRMAGIVGGLGAIAGGYVMMEGNKQDKADRELLKAERDKLNDLTTANYNQSRAENQQLIDWVRGGRKGPIPGVESLQGDSGLSTPDPKPSAPGSYQSDITVETSKPAAPKPSSIGPQAKASPSPGFKGFVDMASKAGAKYPQLVAAQWALESGWGKSPSGTNNYFGIKATAGESSTSKQTWEVYDGKEVTTSANFKNYASPQGSVNDLVSKWHKDYKSYKGVNNASDAFSAADMLREQGYATDPAYSEKLKKIMRDQGY